MSLSIPAAPEALRADFAAVTADQWRALGSRRLYFGHQSVGTNVTEGIAALLRERPDIPLRLADAAGLDSAAAPGLYHGKVGRNEHPDEKTRDFTAMVDRARPGVAMLKYCYVDVELNSSPDSLFAAYQQAVAALRQRHEGLTIVHLTMPLTTIESRAGRKAWLMAKIRGRPTEAEEKRGLNVIRNRYNALLRQAYVGKEPVFDIARVESTRPDGSRSFFTNGSDTVYVMAAENTSDGSHLNDAGKRAAAQEMLALLAGL